MSKSLIPKFTQGDIDRRIDRFALDKEQRITAELALLGEEIINDAKLTGPYRDQTGNLRSSVGYDVAIDGHSIFGGCKASGKQEGVEQAQNLAAELLQKFDKGIVLIVVAGMEYAAAVESKGYSVISNSIPMKEEVLKRLKETGLI